VLKEALSRMANTARRNLEKQTRLAVPVRTMLIVTLFVQLLCLGEPCAQAGDRVKARTAIGYSIDFGAEVESGPATMPIEVSELKQGAESGDALAQNNLAYLYTFGLEVPQDYREAAHWYAIAAAQGFAAAQYNLGALYERGLGVPRDSSRAAEWSSRCRRARPRTGAVTVGAAVPSGVGSPPGCGRGHEVVSPRRPAGGPRGTVQSGIRILLRAGSCARPVGNMLIGKFTPAFGE